MNLRESAFEIFRAAVQAADPRAAVQRTVQRQGDTLLVGTRRRDLSRSRVFVIGFGKASAAMAQAVESICGDKIYEGIVVAKYGHTAPLQRVRLLEAGHPLPDGNSLRATEEILSLLSETTADDLVLCLISGGGSALLELPVEGVSLADLALTSDILMRAGATIDELNVVRRHLSQVKGGRLAGRVHGAQLVSLILSDVIGSPLDTIASGPTAPDLTTFADALNVIERRGVRKQLPAPVIAHIERGARHEENDPNKSDESIFDRVQNVIIADNAVACEAATRTAQSLGWNTLLLTSSLRGEAREMGGMFGAVAREIVRSNQPVKRPACVVAGGETTVTVRGRGKGGRNQELALAAAIELAEIKGASAVLLNGGTDGTDGPTDAAGAIADVTTVRRAFALGMDPRVYLSNNDAYNFFQPLGQLVTTGPTNTNVNDIVLLLVE